MNSTALRTLYLRWVAANALGEMFGLDLTFVVGAVHGACLVRLGKLEKSTG